MSESAEKIMTLCERLFDPIKGASRCYTEHAKVGAIWITRQHSKPQDAPFVQFAIPVGNRTLVARCDIRSGSYMTNDDPGERFTHYWDGREPTDLEMAEMRLIL